MRCPPHLILQHLISSVVSLAPLVSPSVALPAQLVTGKFLNHLRPSVNIYCVKNSLCAMLSLLTFKIQLEYCVEFITLIPLVFQHNKWSTRQMKEGEFYHQTPFITKHFPPTPTLHNREGVLFLYFSVYRAGCSKTMQGLI